MRRIFLYLSLLLVVLLLVTPHTAAAQAIAPTLTEEGSETPTRTPATVTSTAVKSPTPTATVKPSATSDVVEVKKAKPEEDGSVIHVVQKGQALWSIAFEYGTSVEALIALNQLPEEPVLQIGQELMVIPPFTATPTPTASNTPKPPTPSATRTLKPITPGPTSTLTPSATPTSAPLFVGVDSLKGIDRRSMGIGLILVCALGLGGIVFYTIRRRKQEAEAAAVDPVEALLAEKQDLKH